VAAIREYRLILTMPETMSTERVAILRQLGAEIVLTPGILMTDAVAGAESLANEISGAVRIDQFRNPLNPEIHRRTQLSRSGTIPRGRWTCLSLLSGLAARSLASARR